MGKWPLAQHGGAVFGTRVFDDQCMVVPTALTESLCLQAPILLCLSLYRSTASGLHDKPFLVNECNAAKGSRQISCVPLVDAMAPEAGLLVVDS